MRTPRVRPRLCVVGAFELLLPPGPNVPVHARQRRAFDVVRSNLADSGDRERRVMVSDRLVRSASPVKENGTIVFWELLDVVHLQAELCAHDMLLSGALSIGEVEAGDSALFGAGLTAANDLADLAGVPRVVVDPRLMVEAESNPLLRAKHHSVMDELGYIKSLLQQDSDGLWFVDYLGVYCGEADNALAYLDGHRRLVERRLESARDVDQSTRAWTWLRTYHNDFLKRWRDQGRLDDAQRRELHVSARGRLAYAFPSEAKAPD